MVFSIPIEFDLAFRVVVSKSSIICCLEARLLLIIIGASGADDLWFPKLSRTGILSEFSNSFV